MAKYVWIQNVIASVVFGLFLIFLQETHCSVATNYKECRAVSTIYGFSILIAGCILYVLSILSFPLGIIASVSLLLLSSVSNGEGRHSAGESASVYRSRHVKACGGL